jgi:hypothetical protein
MTSMKSMALMAITGSLATVACGVSRDYVAVNAATIRTNSESTLATLDSLKCEPSPAAEAGADADHCAIKKSALEALKDDQHQIQERADALCTAAQSDCKPKP